MAAMAPQATTPLENVPGLGEGVLEKLTAAGITTVEALADMTPEQLEAIEGIGPKTVEKISLAVNNYFASLEGGEAAVAITEEGETQEATSEEGATETPVVGEIEEVAASADEAEPGSADEASEAVEGGEEG